MPSMCVGHSPPTPWVLPPSKILIENPENKPGHITILYIKNLNEEFFIVFDLLTPWE